MKCSLTITRKMKWNESKREKIAKILNREILLVSFDGKSQYYTAHSSNRFFHIEFPKRNFHIFIIFFVIWLLASSLAYNSKKKKKVYFVDPIILDIVVGGVASSSSSCSFTLVSQIGAEKNKMINTEEE